MLLLAQTKHEGRKAMSLAERNGAEIEIVNHRGVLMELGGVGCLVRYPPPEDFYRYGGGEDRPNAKRDGPTA